MIKLKELIFEIEKNAEFENWFRGSKVVDSNGKPLIMYHGSNNKFNEFSLSYTTGQMGFHIGTKEQAKNIKNKVHYLYELYASIKNPIRLKDLGSWYGEDVVDMVNSIVHTKLNSSSSDREIRKTLQGLGYDGVVYENRFEGDGDSFIAFKPTQLKIIKII